MFPSEIVILMAIAINKNTGKQLLSRSMDVTGEYISYLYNSLVNRGYIKGHRAKGYQLTAAGREVILDFLKRRKTRVKDIVKRLQWLGIEVNREQEQKIEKLKKEAMIPK